MVLPLSQYFIQLEEMRTLLIHFPLPFCRVIQSILISKNWLMDNTNKIFYYIDYGDSIHWDFLNKGGKRKEEQRNRGNSGIDNPIFGVASSI